MVVVDAGPDKEVLLGPEVWDIPEAEVVRAPTTAPSLSDIPGMGEVAEPPPVSDMLRSSGSDSGSGSRHLAPLSCCVAPLVPRQAPTHGCEGTTC
ncbi:hypothetical protein E2C01_027587 [Portunus trituberculatus]|uniref:Uncharacterized protein n=1 Tax=Portunus trituberculatus TaxID=210409 RepID=A0A5B7EL94_PORTR|nr:hypothetical protein [Portunus trituberculatus]